MVRELLANGSRIKCGYVWMGMRTCAAPFANNSHTIRREPKFVGFLRKHKENWMRLHALSVLCSFQVRGKLINRAWLTCRTQMAQRISGSCIHSLLLNIKITNREKKELKLDFKLNKTIYKPHQQQRYIFFKSCEVQCLTSNCCQYCQST